ncbi:MAG: dicarboxylate/amino acid:cation symporter [Minwuia sp.]|uniref:dicarboxylate/amino acid:cation symporter n=1 Tax=Minwuia sp. TaxID=2493630 RepID=UPI003A853E56
MAQGIRTQRSLPRLRRHLFSAIRQRLWLQVLVGMFLGVGFGTLVGPASGIVAADYSALIGNWVALPGRLFLLAIQFVVVPLVVASVIRGIAGGSAGSDLGRIGGRAVAFFLATTMLAVAIGVASALLIQPGSFVDPGAVASVMDTAAPAPATPKAPGAAEIPDLIVSIFPTDPLATFVSGNMLQIVIAAAVFGLALVMTPADQRRALLDLMASVQAACMVIVGWVLRFAPLAVFGLLANITARVGLSALLGVGMYVVSVLAGLLVLVAAYLLIVQFRTRVGAANFLRQTREVALLAFSTSSSAAVMPLTLNTVESKLGVSSAVARFVVPLGTTINMAGTALYQGVATLFLAQVFGVELGLGAILLIVIMATGAAVGSPGTPGVGIVILATILASVGIPPAGVAIILGVDRLLDMCRTAVNVSGDMVACLYVDRALHHHGPAAAPAQQESAADGAPPT